MSTKGNENMHIYRQLYPAVARSILGPLRNGRRPSLHGSEVRDAFIEHLAGRAAVGDCAEKLLTELVDAGVLAHDRVAAPTASQRAFFSLSNMREHPGWVPGCAEHFWYRLV